MKYQCCSPCLGHEIDRVAMIKCLVQQHSVHLSCVSALGHTSPLPTPLACLLCKQDSVRHLPQVWAQQRLPSSVCLSYLAYCFHGTCPSCTRSGRLVFRCVSALLLCVHLLADISSLWLSFTVPWFSLGGH